MRGLSALRVSLAVAAVVALCALSAPMRLPDLKILDWRQAHRGPIEAPGDVVIVGIDEQSLAEVGRWPWPRSRIAALVEAISAAGASTIAFDVIFDKPDPTVDVGELRGALVGAIREVLAAPATHRPEDAVAALERLDNDSRLAGAFRASGRVVLAHFFETQGTAAVSETEAARLPEISVRARDGLDPAIVPQRVAKLHLVLPRLAAAAAGTGYVNFFPDRDGMYRRAPLVLQVNGRLTPALGLEVVRHHLGNAFAFVTLAGDGVSAVRVGGLSPPVDARGEMWLDYLGPMRSHPQLSAADLLAGRVPPGSLAGKIVLVGFTATGFDEIPTPFEERAPGVQAQATVIDNLLHGRGLRRPPWTPRAEAAVVVVLGLVLGIALERIRGPLGVLLAFAMAVGWVTTTQYLFVSRRLILSAVYPAGAILFCTLGIMVFHAVAEEREKRKVRHAFGHYLNPEVTELLARDPSRLKLGGERREVTILFSDVRGFTSISEGLEPEALAELLNEYLGAMTDVIFEHEGLLDKFIGDAVMAFWGAPVAVADHAARCCRAALDMRRALRGLHERWRAQGLPLLEIGIGIHTGDAVVGNFGSSQRFNYTVMGDAVNLASRLEGLNKAYGTRVLVSESTRRELGDEFVCREIDWVRVKGRSRPVAIHEVLGRRADDADGRLAALASGFGEALAAYRTRAWDDALARLAALAARYPDDGAIPAFVERCEAQRAAAPGDGWDGVFVARTK
ncbi:MAG TPA: adenylate/guanylate cyclase domain-containing protein [Candidatus Binatia bacterium]|jgi:adenylate cyclase|nr:adenylate/guanylate cyclase domain-containing protein [Candidatus Binatia bacterium]